MQNLLNRDFFSPLFFCAEVFTVFFLPGFLVVTFWRNELNFLTGLLATIFGLELSTTLYALARIGHADFLFYLVVGIASFFGAVKLVRLCKFNTTPIEVGPHNTSRLLDRNSRLAGVLLMLIVGSAFYFSGQSNAEGFSFYGPMAHDPIYHLALIQRLGQAVPPDNYIVSGYPLNGYHFFSDLSQYLLAHDLIFKLDLFDVFFRLYPSLVLFAIGYLSYWVSVKLTASFRAGWIGLCLIIFSGNFSWMVGLLQTLHELPDLKAAVEDLFTSWTRWSAVSGLYPTVHRPAHYHGLLFLLAGLAVIIKSPRESKRGWVLAGLLWGMMAGFNYTFAAVLGFSHGLVACWFLLRRRKDLLIRIVISAFMLALASIPANYIILSSPSQARGGPPFFWAPGEFANDNYGWLFTHFSPGVLPSLGAFAVLLLLCYGFSLLGIGKLLAGKFRFNQHRAIAAIMAVMFVVSVSAALLFRLNSTGGISDNIILLMPTIGLLGLFAIFPVLKVIRCIPTPWRLPVAAFFLLIGVVQGVLSFQFGHKVVISPPVVNALTQIRQSGTPSDVIAFLPDHLETSKILGSSAETNNFYVSAFTGMRSYFLSEGYSLMNVTGDNGLADYRQRRRILANIQEGNFNESELDILYSQGVRWIMLPRMLNSESSRLRKQVSGDEVTVFELLR